MPQQPADKHKPAAARPRRTRLIYLWLLMVSLAVVFALVGGLLVVGPLLERHYMDNLLTGGDAEADAAVRWWAEQVRSEPAQYDRFVAAWRDTGDERPFVRMAKVLIAAGRFSEQPAGLRVRYHRDTRMGSPDPAERVQAVRDLVQFTGQADAGLDRAIDQAIGDAEPAVAAEAAFCLTRWSDQAWALGKLSQLLRDDRPEVRRRAAEACGVVAGDLVGTSAQRMAFLALRARLVEMLVQDAERMTSTIDPDPEARANAAWSLWQMRWMAASALTVPQSEANPAVRQMAVLILSNPPIAEDHTEPEVPAQTLAMLAAYDTDELTRLRAALSLSLTPVYAGPGEDGGPRAAIASMFKSKSWPQVVVGCRLVGLSGAYEFLDALEQLVIRGELPDPVAEQVAFSLGLLARPPYNAEENPEALEQARRARGILAALTNRELIRSGDDGGPATVADPPEGPPASQPEGRSAKSALAGEAGAWPGLKVSPRTWLAAAVAWGGLGELGPLESLAGRRMAPAEAGPVSRETLADMACLALWQLTRGDRERTEALGKTARRFLADYNDRLQRSGALLAGLLGERDLGDKLLARWQSFRQGGSEAEKLGAIYFQAALLLLGRDEPEAQVKLTNWLNDPDGRTAGVYAALILSGRREALDDLLGPEQVAAAALLDDWHLRAYLGEWLAGAIAPTPAADGDLVDLTRRMSIWWYATHRDRLRFDPKERTWAAPIEIR